MNAAPDIFQSILNIFDPSEIDYIIDVLNKNGKIRDTKVELGKVIIINNWYIGTKVVEKLTELSMLYNWPQTIEDHRKYWEAFLIRALIATRLWNPIGDGSDKN
jgi:hypothetical protein